jgi:hypothetical protein
MALSEIGKYRILSRAARKSHRTPHLVALSFKSRVCGVTPSSDKPFFGWPILARVRLRTKSCTSDLCSFAGEGNCHSFGDSKKFSFECHNHSRNPRFVRSFEANSGRNRTSPSGDPGVSRRLSSQVRLHRYGTIACFDGVMLVLHFKEADYYAFSFGAFAFASSSRACQVPPVGSIIFDIPTIALKPHIFSILATWLHPSKSPMRRPRST